MVPIFKKECPVFRFGYDEKEIDLLEYLGVISKVAHSDWASTHVYMKNKICVCTDFSTMLTDCQAYNYLLPSQKVICANGGKYFSNLELSDAYLQVDEKCSKLLSINTHKGLYKFNWLTSGIKLSPGIFQQVMDKMLSGLCFAIAYLDDILIKPENREQDIHHAKWGIQNKWTNICNIVQDLPVTLD